MPLQIQWQRAGGQVETDLTDAGTICTIYDFNEKGIDLVVASPLQLRYYGQLAIFRCPLQDTLEDLSVVTFFSPILSSPIAKATQDDYLQALCREDESYETNITTQQGSLALVRFTLLNAEAAT